MENKHSQSLQKYYEQLKEIKLLSGTSALLEWDQETKMPVKATPFRADQLAYISKLIHEKSTSKSLIALVNELYEAREELDPIDARSVEVSKRDLSKVEKLPTEFVQEFSKLKSLSHESWMDAKRNEDYSRFRPHMQKMFEMSKRYADYIDSNKPTYDVLLDDYEEGMTCTELDYIFSGLRDELKEFIKQIPMRESKGAFEKFGFDKHKARDFIVEMTRTIGFDYDRGTDGEVHHPFETTLASNDVRINMAYHHKDLSASITGAVHELGHGLYEQFVDERYEHTSLGTGVSLGIHESQSRLLENMIGRSLPFWKYFAPKLAEYMGVGHDVSPEDIVHDLNIVEPSFIRIEADEVTYNMHIILRYEIEQGLLNGDISFDDLPDVWNSRMEDFLGIVPDKLSRGVLQDVHWSMGLVAYFPTYSLGNLNAGQLWRSFKTANPGWEKKIEQGDFSPYFDWFKGNIWEHGSFYKPNDLIKRVTGESLQPKYLSEYLREKYLD